MPFVPHNQQVLVQSNQFPIPNTAHSSESSFSNNVDSVMPPVESAPLVVPARLQSPLPDPQTHQVTFDFIDQRYANLNVPKPLSLQEEKKYQFARLLYLSSVCFCCE